MSTPDSPPLKLGELLIKEGYLTPDMLKALLEEQKEQDFISAHRKAYKPLGQLCIEKKLISPEELQRVLKKHDKRIRLGELMVNMNMIKEEQLEEALKTQKKALGMKLGELLVEDGIVTEQQVVEALSIQLDVPRVFPALELLEDSLMERFDLRFLEEELCVPMHQDYKGLTMVMADPLNDMTLESLAKQSGAKIVPALAPASVLREVLEEYKNQKYQRSLSADTTQVSMTTPMTQQAPAAESSPQVGGVNV